MTTTTTTSKWLVDDVWISKAVTVHSLNPFTIRGTAGRGSTTLTWAVTVDNRGRARLFVQGMARRIDELPIIRVTDDVKILLARLVRTLGPSLAAGAASPSS